MIRTSIIIAALVVGLLGTTAATCSKPITDAGKYCAETAGKGSLDEILPRVNEAIGCSIADSSAIPECMLSGLQALATEFGKDFLMCALEQIASAKFAKPGDTTAGVKQKRANAYLESQKPKAGICAGCGNKWTLRSESSARDTLTVPIGHGRFNSLPVDEATRMTGAMPIGLTDYDDVQCANFEVAKQTGVILSVRRWYCESI